MAYPKVKDTGKTYKIGRGGDGNEIAKGFRPSDLGLSEKSEKSEKKKVAPKVKPKIKKRY